MIKKINSFGLCEKCNKIVKPYFIIKGKYKDREKFFNYNTVRCYKHLPKEVKKEVNKYYKLKNKKIKTLKELKRKKELLKLLKMVYKKGIEYGKKIKGEK